MLCIRVYVMYVYRLSLSLYISLSIYLSLSLSIYIYIYRYLYTNEDFLQQNGFTDYDFMCPLAKTIGMMKVAELSLVASSDPMRDTYVHSLMFKWCPTHNKHGRRKVVGMEMDISLMYKLECM